MSSIDAKGESSKRSRRPGENPPFLDEMALFEVLFKRTSTLALTVAVGAFAFERTFDVIANGIFDKINEGKQWKDIKQNYGA